MRKLLCLLTLAAAAAATAAAQHNPPRDPQLPAGLTVGAADWTHVPLIFENAFMVNPSGGGGGGRNVPSRDPSTPTHVASALAQARGRFSDRGRSWPVSITSSGGWRWASVELAYAGAKKIRRVHLDFVFTDPQTGAEVLRISMRTPKRLRAGQTRLFRKEVNATETNRRGDGARLSVEIKEVVYADGSVWTPGG